MSRKLLLLEFNELCPHLLEKWMGEGKLPNFQRFYSDSQAYITEADAEPPALEPWIQWYSVHTGLSYDQHHVFRLTDGSDAGHPDMWQIVREAGLKTGNFSSMNAKGYAAERSFYLPDPWCTTERSYPEELEAFRRFVSQRVQEYTNPTKAAAATSTASFIAFLATHGIRPRTVTDICKQLFADTFLNRTTSWRRVVVLDWIQRDVFLHYYRKYKPDLATFFLNSTAHLQHAYWRFMEPEQFEVKPDLAQVRIYRDAIFFGYRNMDRLLGDFFELEKDGVTLVLLSTLSQRPFTKYEALGGQHFYRPRDVDNLLSRIGVRHTSVKPVMAHQYVLQFDTVEEQERAYELLTDVTSDGDQVFLVDRNVDLTLFIGSQFRTLVSSDQRIRLSRTTNDSEPILDVFYMIDAIKSGCHHPDGVLWIKTGQEQVHPRKVSVLDVFPTILDMLNVDYPPSERHPYRGRSLVPDWSETGFEYRAAGNQ